MSALQLYHSPSTPPFTHSHNSDRQNEHPNPWGRRNHLEGLILGWRAGESLIWHDDSFGVCAVVVGWRNGGGLLESKNSDLLAMRTMHSLDFLRCTDAESSASPVVAGSEAIPQDTC